MGLDIRELAAAAVKFAERLDAVKRATIFVRGEHKEWKGRGKK